MRTNPATRARIALTLSVLFAASHAAICVAAEAPRGVATDLRALFREAIDSPDGRVRATLRSSEAEVLTRQAGMTKPVVVDIDTETIYAQEGCRRLRVTFVLEGVRLEPGASPQNRAMQYGINYCRDGRPPQSLAVKGAR